MLGDLVGLINRRSASWRRSVPRIVAGRTLMVMHFLQGWPDELGEVGVDLTHSAPAVTFDLLPALDPINKREVAPFGTFRLTPTLAGPKGANRSPAFCFISALSDLEAIQFPRAIRWPDAYTKELERFVLWCALVAFKPMPSLMVDDCEAYKSFLVAPLPEFCGSAR